MENIWPENTTYLIPASELTQFVLDTKRPEYLVYHGILKTTGRPVTMKVLTVDGATARSRFVQEAALLKLLKHKNIPNLVGVSTLPPRFVDIRENSTRALPVIVAEQHKGSSLSSYLQASQFKRKSKKERTRHYDIILDVLIDVTDALLYLHERHPAVVHRGLSMAHITVAETDSGTFKGTLNDLSSALLCAEETRRVKKLGVESLTDDALNSEDLLSVDFFKEPMSFTTSHSPTTTQRAPQFPLLTSSIANTPQKTATNSRKSMTSVPPVPREKRSGKSVDMTGGSIGTPRIRPTSAMSGMRSKTSSMGSVVSSQSKEFVGKKKGNGKVQTPFKRPLEIQEEEGVMDGDVASTSTSRHSERRHSTPDVDSQYHHHHDHNKVEDSPIAFSVPPHASMNPSSVGPQRTPLMKTRGYDSASSSRWVDCLINDKDGAEITDLSTRTSLSDAIPVAKQLAADWTPIDSSSTPLSCLSSVDDTAARADSLTHLKRCFGEAHLAPEVLRGQSYGKASDVFSLGIIIYSSLARMAPIALSQKPGHYQFTFDEGFPWEVQSLVVDCCDIKPTARPNIKAVKARLQSIKASGCIKNLGMRKRKRFSCFGRFE